MSPAPLPCAARQKKPRRRSSYYHLHLDPHLHPQKQRQKQDAAAQAKARQGVRDSTATASCVSSLFFYPFFPRRQHNSAHGAKIPRRKLCPCRRRRVPRHLRPNPRRLGARHRSHTAPGGRGRVQPPRDDHDVRGVGQREDVGNGGSAAGQGRGVVASGAVSAAAGEQQGSAVEVYNDTVVDPFAKDSGGGSDRAKKQKKEERGGESVGCESDGEKEGSSAKEKAAAPAAPAAPPSQAKSAPSSNTSRKPARRETQPAQAQTQHHRSRTRYTGGKATLAGSPSRRASTGSLGALAAAAPGRGEKGGGEAGVEELGADAGVEGRAGGGREEGGCGGGGVLHGERGRGA
ncbi:hypothetical protein EKO27_g10472 [Xylaria grammica]|uniref:Uncharacterized protein n=1 Tax=Xylaria grammica TaxID=363999 RepID=A0A439CR42_9PEZI|nr:hypothetical protein EKO27_g10472 [Xylaria grammica]